MRLTDSEIKKRMVELQNLRKLHTKARNRVLILESENKNLKLRVTVLEKENKELKRELSDIKYQLTELQTILFKKKATDRDISSFDDDEEPKPPPVQRIKNTTIKH
jgi:predicted RNase H-like nuclease (RuvC/YqgF family)